MAISVEFAFSEMRIGYPEDNSLAYNDISRLSGRYDPYSSLYNMNRLGFPSILAFKGRNKRPIMSNNWGPNNG